MCTRACARVHVHACVVEDQPVDGESAAFFEARSTHMQPGGDSAPHPVSPQPWPRPDGLLPAGCFWLSDAVIAGLTPDRFQGGTFSLASFIMSLRHLSFHFSVSSFRSHPV